MWQPATQGESKGSGNPNRVLFKERRRGCRSAAPREKPPDPAQGWDLAHGRPRHLSGQGRWSG